MNKKVFFIFVSFTFVFSFLLVQHNSFSQTQQPPDQTAVDAPQEKIVDIKIAGNKSVSTATILNKIKIRIGDAFEEAAVNKEIKRLYAMGYFSDVFVETTDTDTGVVVMFTVVEKPLVSSIQFMGNKRIKEVRLKKNITIKDGDLLDYNIIAQDVTAVRNYYVSEGYSRASVDYRIEADESGERAIVVFVIDEGKPLTIKSIKVEGNKKIKAGEITKVMSTKSAWWFINKGSYDEDKLEEDLYRVSNLYRSKGYLDVKVTSREEYSADGKYLYLTVVIEEGKAYKVTGIEVTGELAFPKEDVVKNIKMKKGDPFDYELLKNDLESIRSFYYDKGYMNVEVDRSHRYDSASDGMTIIYNVTANNEVYVGKVNVIGNTVTKDKVIRREIRLYPGDKYDGKKLKRSKERIYNLGFFEDVYFEPTATSDKDVKDLNVTVKETKTGEFSFGGGYSSVDAFIGFVQLRQKNFDIMNFPTFSGSGQDLTMRAELGSNRNNFFLGWTDPWIFDYPYLFGFDVYRQEQDRSGIAGFGTNERRIGGDLKLGKEITDYLSTGLVYTLEQVRISDIPAEATDDLRKEEGENTISRLTWNINYDKRDNKFAPSKGYFTALSLQDAGGFLGGDKDFLKGQLTGSYYHSIINRVVLELRATSGLSDAYGDSDDLPIYERFYAGGARTIRGYKERGVGPRDAGSNAPLGGEAMAVGNVELTFPIFENLIKGAVFYDVGNVWARVQDAYTSSDYKQGVGVGVRVKTPIGPIQLDFGYPLNENNNDKKEGRFYFSVSQGF